MTTATQSLTSWLLECIAADEAAAREAQALASAPWRATHGRQVETAQEGRPVTPEDEHTGRDDRPDDVAAHIARHDPAHVLAVCAAHRSIVEALIDAEDAVAKYDNDDPDNPPSYWQDWGNRHALALSVEALATAYADRPGWQEAWR